MGRQRGRVHRLFGLALCTGSVSCLPAPAVQVSCNINAMGEDGAAVGQSDASSAFTVQVCPEPWVTAKSEFGALIKALMREHAVKVAI